MMLNSERDHASPSFNAPSDERFSLTLPCRNLRSARLGALADVLPRLEGAVHDYEVMTGVSFEERVRQRRVKWRLA